MRKSPQFLAYFFIAITIVRVAIFLYYGLPLGWMGVAFAIGLSASVYVLAYFTQYAETRLWAWLALPVFMAVDLWFNELEVVRVLSIADLVPPNANFLGMTSADLVWAYQWAGIAFGAFPTIAAAGLGLVQGGANKIQEQIKSPWAVKFVLAIAAKITKHLPAITETDTVEGTIIPENQPKLSGKGKRIPFEQLTSEQKSALPLFSDGQLVSKYGISARTARDWKKRVRENK